MICNNTTSSQAVNSLGQDSIISEIKKQSVIVDCKDGEYILKPYNLPLEISEPLKTEKMDEFAAGYTARNKEVSKAGYLFEKMLTDVGEKPYQRKSKKELIIPLGIGNQSRVVEVVIGDDSPHGLIVGTTGSGKTILLHSLILSSMYHYSPDELQLYLMDFKQGVEFDSYKKYRLPHLKLLSAGSMQEFGLSILEKMKAEIDARAKLFREAGVVDIKAYIEKTNKKLPRALVIMDEFQVLFDTKANRQVASECGKLLEWLLRQGRSYGIHILMASQSVNDFDSGIDGNLFKQMPLRLGLSNDDAAVRSFFGEKIGESAIEILLCWTY